MAILTIHPKLGGGGHSITSNQIAQTGGDSYDC